MENVVVSEHMKSCETYTEVSHLPYTLNLNPTHIHNANPNLYMHKYKSPDRFAKHQVLNEYIDHDALHFSVGAPDTKFDLNGFGVLHFVPLFCFCTVVEVCFACVALCGSETVFA